MSSGTDPGTLPQQRLAGERGIALHGQHDDGGVARQLGNGGQARLAGHVEIEHEDVGLVAVDAAARGVHLAGLGDDGHVLLGVEEQLQSGPHDRVIVGEQYADLGHVIQARSKPAGVPP